MGRAVYVSQKWPHVGGELELAMELEDEDILVGSRSSLSDAMRASSPDSFCSKSCSGSIMGEPSESDSSQLCPINSRATVVSSSTVRVTVGCTGCSIGCVTAGCITGCPCITSCACTCIAAPAIAAASAAAAVELDDELDATATDALDDDNTLRALDALDELGLLPALVLRLCDFFVALGDRVAGCVGV